MSLATNLSRKDQHVLSAIFATGEEEQSPRNEQIKVDMELPPDGHVADIEPLVAEEKRIIRMVEAQADPEWYFKALSAFNQIIAREPHYASAYNNRAQLRRLETPSSADTRDAIISDLKRAISLAQAEPSADGVITVSKMQGSILSQAYAQLGAIYLTMAEETKHSEDAEAEARRWEIEENASSSLFYAGLFGNELARAVATKVNPYAKLCGNMVREAMIAEYSSHQISSH
ncbi:hypothetical protein TRVA0_053S00694 [Trichomonascus vanleenenianus]|uniref:uncharacterized protein n=1 Tax=Trichomonascus vanleenenianus TaxID=2268995 RepID=UPI003EC9DCDB